MAEDKKTRTTKEPKVQDVSSVLEDATRTILDLDARLERMRQDLDGLRQSAGLPAPSMPHGGGGFQGPTPFGPMMGPMWGAAAPFAGQPMMPSGPGAAQPFPGSATAWSARRLRERAPLQREPPADVIDAGDGFVIQLEVPGVKKEDLDIMATDHQLVITGEYRPELDDEGVVMVSERGPIAYRRKLELPAGIQTSECKATLKDGLLTLRVPKKSPSDGAHHVNIAYS